MLSTIDLGGILFLFVIAAVIVAVIVFNKWRKGEQVVIPNIKTFGKKADTGTHLCWNIYADRFVGEEMLLKSIAPGARILEIGGKKGYFQRYSNTQYRPAELPTVVRYDPCRLARMLGCEPLRHLKSLKYGWLEQLAPFAPVAALGIGALLFTILVG